MMQVPTMGVPSGTLPASSLHAGAPHALCRGPAELASDGVRAQTPLPAPQHVQSSVTRVSRNSAGSWHVKGTQAAMWHSVSLPSGSRLSSLGSRGQRGRRFRLSARATNANETRGKGNQVPEIQEYEEEEDEDEEEEDEYYDEDEESGTGLGISAMLQEFSSSVAAGNWGETVGERMGVEGPVGKVPVAVGLGLGAALAVSAAVSIIGKIKGKEDEKAGTAMPPDVPPGFGIGVFTTVRSPEKDLKLLRRGFPLDKPFPGVEEAAKRRKAEEEVAAAAARALEVAAPVGQTEELEISTSQMSELAGKEGGQAALQTAAGEDEWATAAADSFGGSDYETDIEDLLTAVSELQEKITAVEESGVHGLPQSPSLEQALKDKEQGDERDNGSGVTVVKRSPLVDGGDVLTEEALVAVVEERVAELELQYREEIEALRQTAETETRVLRMQAGQRATLEREIGELRHQLVVVKELAEHLLDAEKSREEEAEALRDRNAALSEQFDKAVSEQLSKQEAAMQEKLAAQEASYKDQVRSLADRLEDEASRRRDLRAALAARQAYVALVEGRLKDAESDRDRLTKELRLALVECERLSNQCESLAAEVDSARAAKEQAAAERDEMGQQLNQVETELREMRRTLQAESARLAEVEEAVGIKMTALGEKEWEVERMHKELEGSRREASVLRAELAQQEAALAKDRREFEAQQANALEELAWLRTTAGEATLLAEELSEVKAELKQYKTKDAALRGRAAEAADAGGSNINGGATAGGGSGAEPGAPVGSGLDASEVAAASAVAGIPAEALKLAQELKAVRERLAEDTRVQQDRLSELSRKLADAPKLAEELAALKARQLADEEARKREVEAGRALVAKLSWRLAEAQAEQVRAERLYLEQVTGLQQQLTRTGNGSVDARLQTAQTEIEELRNRLAEQEAKLELFRKQAEVALSARERQLQMANQKHLEELQDLEARLVAALAQRQEQDRLESFPSAPLGTINGRAVASDVTAATQ